MTKTVAFLLLLLAVVSCKQNAPEPEIVGIRYKTAYRNNQRGDTWIATWADDGNFYSTVDDCVTDSTSSNLGFLILKGDDPTALQPVMINPMSEYGIICELDRDSLAWKASGLTCVDNVLYMFVSRHRYPWLYNPRFDNNRQTAQDGSIIKSTDYGKTWTRTAQENMDNPMFPGRRFAAGFFMEYGKDVPHPNDGSDKYFYAVANDGYWNNGNDMVTGRVLKSKLPDLNGSDWEFYKGDGKSNADNDWTKELNAAVPVLTDSMHVGMSAVTYIPAAKKYVLAQWYFPMGNFCGATAIWSFRQSPTPWGPWEKFSSDTFPLQGYYNPAILSKFMKEDGSSYITVAGDCQQQDTYYKLHTIPFELSIKRGSDHK